MPQITVSTVTENSESFEDFVSNGSLIPPEPECPITSTPIREQPDLFVLGSPIRGSSVSSLSDSDSDPCCRFLRGPAANLALTDSENEQEPDYPSRWIDRKIKCVKYVDDCLFLERLCFGGKSRWPENINDTIGTRSLHAEKTQNHFRTVE